MARRIAVIGLGHFGFQLAVELGEKGAEVLALDDSLDRLEDVRDHVTSTVRLDATEEKALRAQGLKEFDAVVVAFGDDFEVTLLTVAALQKIGVPRIIVRATTEVHERILNHLGVREVILPAAEAALRLANSLLFERVVDSFALSSDYTIAEVSTPDAFVDRKVHELQINEQFDVTLITIKRREVRKGFLGIGSREVEAILGRPGEDTTIERGDVLVVFGTKKAIERLAQEQ